MALLTETKLESRAQTKDNSETKLKTKLWS